MRVVVAVIGGLVIVADMADLVKALVVPRPSTRSPTARSVIAVRSLLHRIAGAMPTFAQRDRFLAVAEPTMMLVRLLLWLAIGLVGFALLLWGTGATTITHAFVVSGSSVFTLGFAVEGGGGPSVVIFLAAAFGLVVVALQIAYLPALYAAFNRREMLVTMLESRAGTPAWGPELLARHYLVGIEGNLAPFYAEWEQWAADVGESHTTYPTLLYLRSPHPTNSWIVGLVAVLDSAALYLALSPSTAPAEARLCLRMGFTALRDIARAVGIAFDPDPMPDTPIALERREFDEAVARMGDAGVPLERSADDAWPHFVGWRTNYESVAFTLADKVYAPPALWTGARRYQRDGHLAPRRPVDRTPAHPEGAPPRSPPSPGAPSTTL